MPLPNPEKNETEQEFVSRCIGLVVGDGTVENTPDGRAQGSAMCFRQYRDSKKSARTMRAYSLLNVKSFDEEARLISGIATTPQTDLMEDVVDPKGAQFNLPIPFLYQHDSRQPIGHVRNARVTDEGIAVDVQLAKVTEPGRLKERLDEAWQSIKHGLVRGLSIGFKDLESEPIKGSNWGRNIKKWSWLELSAVTIAANVDASITAIKQIDRKLLAASGHKQTCPMPDPGESEQDYMDRCTAAMGDNADAEDMCSAMWDQQMPSAMGKASKPKVAGASAKRSFSLKPKEAKMAKLTINERITNLEATRAADVAALETLNQKAADEGRTKDESEQNSFDDLVAKIEGVDRELSDCRTMEKISKAAAVPVNGGTPQQAADSRGGSRVIQVKSVLPPHMAFIRTICCRGNALINNRDAAQVAKEWYPDTPEVELALKAASTAATAQTATWATELALANNLASAFISYLWPTTLVGRIAGFTEVPFNVRIPKQSSGSGIVSAWVGEGASKPVGQFTTATVTLRWAKTASIITFTDELARFSNPSIEGLVRDTLTRGIGQFIDKQFFDPTVAAVANVSPASITNGAANDPASGTDFNAVLSDVKQAFAHFQLFNVPLDGLAWVMEPTQAVGLSFLRTPLGTTVFGDVLNGGNFLGYPVYISPSVGAGRVVLIRPQDILVARDPGVTIDVSREASIQLDTAPATPPTTVHSLWQENLVGVRAEMYITWARAHDESVYYITGATYGGVATAH